MKTLPRYTWDQATILNLATARAFTVLGVPAGTVRAWASEGLIRAVGKAPGGAHLYQIAEVSAVADRPRKTRGRRKAS